ncbi:hypothetical protein XACB100_220025 [Xanthomonas citri pv. citri]|nr:hypothetical protein XACB100_220025 [Xanthomonas citri pv. citri]
MPARVFERDHRTGGGAVDHHVQVAELARAEHVLDLMVPGNGVPRVEGKQRLGLRHDRDSWVCRQPGWDAACAGLELVDAQSQRWRLLASEVMYTPETM